MTKLNYFEVVDLKKLKNNCVRTLAFALGYTHQNSLRNYRNLYSTTRAFLAQYTAKGNRISPTKWSNPEEARRCAREYLVEFGPELFPEGRKSLPVWPRDQDLIVECLAYIFVRHTFHDYQHRRKMKATKKTTPSKARTKPDGKRISNKMILSNPPVDDFPLTTAGKSQEVPIFIDSDTPSPSSSPSPSPSPESNFDSNSCIQYIQSLNPLYEAPKATSLTMKWLSENDGSLPDSTDKRLQRFMHERDLYYPLLSTCLTMEELVQTLVNGTELAALQNPLNRDAQLYDNFLWRIHLLIEVHIEHFKSRHLIECKLNDELKKTEDFDKQWAKCSTHWNLDTRQRKPAQPQNDTGSPQKKRRKLVSRTCLAERQHPKSPTRYRDLGQREFASHGQRQETTLRAMEGQTNLYSDPSSPDTFEAERCPSSFIADHDAIVMDPQMGATTESRGTLSPIPYLSGVGSQSLIVRLKVPNSLKTDLSLQPDLSQQTPEGTLPKPLSATDKVPGQENHFMESEDRKIGSTGSGLNFQSTKHSLDKAAISRGQQAMCSGKLKSSHWVLDSSTKEPRKCTEKPHILSSRNTQRDGTRWLWIRGEEPNKEIIFEDDICSRILCEWTQWEREHKLRKRVDFYKDFIQRFAGIGRSELKKILNAMVPTGKSRTQTTTSTSRTARAPTAIMIAPSAEKAHLPDSPQLLPPAPAQYEHFSRDCETLTANCSLQKSPRAPLERQQLHNPNPDSYFAGNSFPSPVSMSAPSPVSLPSPSGEVNIISNFASQPPHTSSIPRISQRTDSYGTHPFHHHHIFHQISSTHAIFPLVTSKEVPVGLNLESQTSLRYQSKSSGRDAVSAPQPLEDGMLSIGENREATNVTCGRCKLLNVECINSGLGSTCEKCRISDKLCSYEKSTSKKTSKGSDRSASEETIASQSAPKLAELPIECRTPRPINKLVSLRDPVNIVSKEQPEYFVNSSETEEDAESHEDERWSGRSTGLNTGEGATIMHSTKASLSPAVPEQDVGYCKPGSELVDPRYIREQTPQALSGSKEVVLSSAKAPPRLTFYFEKEDSSLDHLYPISSREFFGLSVYSVFQLIAQRTGKSLASVRIKCYNFAKKKRPFRLERYSTEERQWAEIKEAMEEVFTMWTKKKPDWKEFDMKIVTDLDDEQDDD